MPKTLKIKKHPSDMTTEETLAHLFHPKVVKHIKGVLEKHDSEPLKKSTKKRVS